MICSKQICSLVLPKAWAKAYIVDGPTSKFFAGLPRDIAVVSTTSYSMPARIVAILHPQAIIDTLAASRTARPPAEVHSLRSVAKIRPPPKGDNTTGRGMISRHSRLQ